MDTRLVKEFVCLAHELSFGKAALKLEISETVLSRHISQLEEELGVSFFERNTRTIKLNAYGLIFLEYAEKFIHMQNRYFSALERLREDKEQHLYVSCDCDIGDWLERFQEENPKIQLELSQDSEEHGYFQGGRTDVILTAEPGNLPDSYHIIPFCTYEYVVMLPMGDPLTAMRKVEIRQLRGRKFAMLERQWERKKGIHSFSEIEAIHPKVFSYLNDVVAVANWVKAGNCVAIVKRDKVVDALADEIEVRKLIPRVFQRIYVCYDSLMQMSLALESFLSFVERNREEEEEG